MDTLNKEKISELFHIWQGHQITDEEIYNSEKGIIPIITGHNIIKGYITKPYISDVPCITIPSKGVVNRLYIQKQPFDANNTIALIPKNRKKIDLEYFVFTQSDYITSFISSTSTNNYLNRAILENVEIMYPSYPIQQHIGEEYKKLIKMKEEIENNINLLSKQLLKDVKVKGRKVTMDDVFNIIVGHDDSLTEKYAYNNTGKIPIYSGATDNNGIFRYANRTDYNFDDYITWVIDGKAGTMFHRHGPCSLARHCGILIPKNEKEIALDWFIFTQQSMLQHFALGRGGLGNLKKNLIEIYSFILPKKQIQDKIVEDYKKLLILKEQIESIISEIDNQLKKVISC